MIAPERPDSEPLAPSRARCGPSAVMQTSGRGSARCSALLFGGILRPLHGAQDDLRGDSLIYMQGDDIHSERGVLRFTRLDQLWIEVRVVGVLLCPALPLLVRGRQASRRVVEATSVVTVVARSVAVPRTSRAGHDGSYTPSARWPGNLVRRARVTRGGSARSFTRQRTRGVIPGNGRETATTAPSHEGRSRNLHLSSFQRAAAGVRDFPYPPRRVRAHQALFD